MKPDQYKAWKSIRKPTPPPTKVEHPKKGAPYQRRGRYRMKYGIDNYEPDDWRDQ